MRPTDKPLPLAKERRNGGRLGFHRLLRQGIQDCHFLGQRFVPGFKGLRVFRIPQAGSRCRWTSQQLLLRDLRWFRGPDACRSCRPGKQPSTGWCGFVWTCHRGPSISKRWSSWQPLPWPRSWWSAVRGICSGAPAQAWPLGDHQRWKRSLRPKWSKRIVFSTRQCIKIHSFWLFFISSASTTSRPEELAVGAGEGSKHGNLQPIIWNFIGEDDDQPVNLGQLSEKP